MTTETPAADVVERLRKNAEWRNERLQTMTSSALLLAAADEITRLCAENAELHRKLDEAAKDTARLDYLDECNQRLNAHYGTNYGWTLIQNHNVNRLMLGHLEVDLNDAEGGKAKLPSCRAAIDARISEQASIRGEA